MNAAHTFGLLAALSSALSSCTSVAEPIPLRIASPVERAASLQADDAAPIAPHVEREDAPPFCRAPRPLLDDGKFYVLGSEAEHPFVRYLDGQVSLNSTCAIRRGNKLSRKVPPVYVNGRPIGFC